MDWSQPREEAHGAESRRFPYAVPSGPLPVGLWAVLSPRNDRYDLYGVLPTEEGLKPCVWSGYIHIIDQHLLDSSLESNSSQHQSDTARPKAAPKITLLDNLVWTKTSRYKRQFYQKGHSKGLEMTPLCGKSKGQGSLWGRLVFCYSPWPLTKALLQQNNPISLSIYI